MKMTLSFCVGWIILGILFFIYYFISRNVNYIIGSLILASLSLFVYIYEKMLDYRKNKRSYAE